MNSLKGIVIAGNYQQYKEWCQKNKYNYTDYQYVSKPSDMCGYKHTDIFYVGQYWLSPLWGRIREVALRELENVRRKNMIKISWKEVIALFFALSLAFGVGIFGISKLVNLLEELTITYFIR